MQPSLPHVVASTASPGHSARSLHDRGRAICNLLVVGLVALGAWGQGSAVVSGLVGIHRQPWAEAAVMFALGVVAQSPHIYIYMEVDSVSHNSITCTWCVVPSIAMHAQRLVSIKLCSRTVDCFYHHNGKTQQ